MMSPDTSNRPAARTASRIKPGRDGGGAGITAAAVIVALVLGMIGIFSVAAGAAPQIGQAAPDFTAVDSQGNSVQLHSFRGKTIVLEWTNAGCPYTRLYAAKTTPHLFVIDKSGAVQYMGGIDSIATADVADIPRAEPYLKEAMLAVVEGNPVPHAVTKPYGCSIKY